MKCIILFTLLSISTSLVYSQDTVTVFTDYSNPNGNTKDFNILKYSRFSGEELNFEFDVIYFLTEASIIASENFSELYVRIMSAPNTNSEDDFAHGETTSKIVIATSEIDMVPMQSIFVIMPLFNPKLISLNSIDSYNANLTLEHGYYDKRKLLHFRVGVDDIEWIKN
jgi:hypothetical protein